MDFLRETYYQNPSFYNCIIGLLIFGGLGEGTRYSSDKLRRALNRLKQRNDVASQPLAQLTSVLPPKFGGVLALLDSNELDAVFCAHDGLQSTRSLKELLSGDLINSVIKVTFWKVPKDQIPREPEALREWFAGEWVKVDRWVANTQGERKQLQPPY